MSVTTDSPCLGHGSCPQVSEVSYNSPSLGSLQGSMSSEGDQPRSMGSAGNQTPGIPTAFVCGSGHRGLPVLQPAAGHGTRECGRKGQVLFHFQLNR